MQESIRVATYRRVSTITQAEEGESLDIQLHRLHAYAEANGWTVVQDYCDAGISGAKENRPALARLLEDARAGLFEKVLVLKLDRLTRSVKHFHELADFLERHGVAIVSITQNIDTSTPTGRLLRNILVDFANFEREMIAERARETKEGLVEQGRWYTGKPPWGMVRGEDGVVRPDPEHGETVRRLFEEYDNAIDPSIKTLARELGIPVTRATEILKNPVYAGYLAFRRRKRLPNGSRIRLPRDQWQYIKSPYIEPLISWELWKRVQEKLISRRHFASPGGLKESVFHGLVFCATCGKTLHRTRSRDHAYYRCVRRDTVTSTRHITVRQDLLTAAVLDEVDRLVNMDEVWQHAIATQATASQRIEEERQNLREQIVRVDTRIARLVEQMADGELADLIRPKLLELKRERQELEARLSDLDFRVTGKQSQLEEYRRLLSNLRAAYNVATWEERRELFATLIERIEVGAETTRITWADPSVPSSVIPSPVPHTKQGRPFFRTIRATLESIPDEELARLYKEKGRKALAKELGINPTTLYYEMVRRGLLERRSKEELRRVLGDIPDEELLAMVASMGTRGVAERFGVDRSTVNKELRRRGLPHPNKKTGPKPGQ